MAKADKMGYIDPKGYRQVNLYADDEMSALIEQARRKELYMGKRRRWSLSACIKECLRRALEGDA